MDLLSSQPADHIYLIGRMLTGRELLGLMRASRFWKKEVLELLRSDGKPNRSRDEFLAKGVAVLRGMGSVKATSERVSYVLDRFMSDRLTKVDIGYSLDYDRILRQARRITPPGPGEPAELKAGQAAIKRAAVFWAGQSRIYENNVGHTITPRHIETVVERVGKSLVHLSMGIQSCGTISLDPRILSKCHQLEVLNLRGYSLAGLSEIWGHCPNLTHIDLTESKISGGDMVELMSIDRQSLRRLILYACTGMTRDDLVAIGKATLELLDVGGMVWRREMLNELLTAIRVENFFCLDSSAAWIDAVPVRVNEMFEWCVSLEKVWFEGEVSLRPIASVE